MGRLTTHVLDTSTGKPATGIQVDLYWNTKLLKKVVMNGDGRSDGALLEGKDFVTGKYTLVFHVGEYFQSLGAADAGVFLSEVPVVFVIGDVDGKYHVPLLVSPWAYSTYRGS